MKDIVIYAHSREGLMDQVAAYLAQGWTPQGGVSVCPIDNANHPRGTLEYSQAMVFGQKA